MRVQVGRQEVVGVDLVLEPGKAAVVEAGRWRCIRLLAASHTFGSSLIPIN